MHPTDPASQGAAEPVVRLTIARHEPEAELVCGMLRGSGIRCVHRITDLGFGSGGEMPSSGAGAREVLVLERDLERARELLAGDTDPGGDDR